MYRDENKIRLTRLEAQKVFTDDHRVRGAIISEPLAIEPDNKPGKGYYLNGNNVKLVRMPRSASHPKHPYALVTAR
jgi:hypothetical protein